MLIVIVITTTYMASLEASYFYIIAYIGYFTNLSNLSANVNAWRGLGYLTWTFPAGDSPGEFPKRFMKRTLPRWKLD